MEKVEDTAGLKSEFKRKGIHLLSSVVPVSYYYIERNTLLLILLAGLVSMILIDYLRFRKGIVKDSYDKYLGDILREHETDNSKMFYFTGGTYIVLAFLICILLFEKNIAILSMLIIVFSDTSAAITGKHFGKHFIGKKTIEGGIAFFLTGAVLFFLVMKPDNTMQILYGLAAVLLTALFELLPIKLDDNISIPVFFGILYSIISKTDFLI